MFKRAFHVFGGSDRPNANTCAEIIKLGEKFPVADTKIGFGEKGRQNDEYRRSELRWIPNSEQFVAGLIWHYVNFANRNSFGLDIDWIYDIQLAKYEATNQGHYDWHQDTFLTADAPYQRKLSFVMQLSDPSEYEGGDFMLLPNYAKGWDEAKAEAFKAQGTIIVFPSFAVHKVTPVTKGVRRSLVAWAEGPHWR